MGAERGPGGSDGGGGVDMTLFFNSSSVGGATQITGSFITPQVRRMGPDGRSGLFVRGRTRGICLLS